MECCQAGRRRVGVQRERGVAMQERAAGEPLHATLERWPMGRTLDRGKHMVLADVPVRSLTASHEVRLDSQRNRTCINPVSHLRGGQDVVDAATARRQLASCHEHADQRGARLSPDVNGTAHCGPLVRLRRAATRPHADASRDEVRELSHSFPWVISSVRLGPAAAYCAPGVTVRIMVRTHTTSTISAARGRTWHAVAKGAPKALQGGGVTPPARRLRPRLSGPRFRTSKRRRVREDNPLAARRVCKAKAARVEVEPG